jgi:hypothetical protein
MTKLHDSIAPIVTAALKDGFKAYALPERFPHMPVEVVYVCLDEAGSFAAIQRPTNSWEDAHLDVPIKPSREYGSGVLVDYDGTVEGAIKSLRAACESPTVTVRFIAKRGQAAPIVPNYGRAAIDKWRDGVHVLTTADLEA